MRILYPTDFSATAAKAHALALELGERLGATLHAVHVLERLESNGTPHYPLADLFARSQQHQVEEAHHETIERLHQQLTALAGPGGSYALLHGRPVPELLRLAPDFDLIVMGAHGANRLDNLLLGGVAGRLARSSPIPVVTVRHESDTETVARALVVTDFGDASRHAMRWCHRLHQAGIELLVAHVIDDPDLQDDPAYLTRMQDALEAFGGGEAERHLLDEGDPSQRLPALAAELEADLIVVGVHPHNSFIGHLLGSVADALLRRSPIPLLTVPLDDSERVRELAEEALDELH